MEDEARKKSTDCVYYLASPLTCKKGNECEFRHSEAARLNTRDCWFWLNSTCLNRNCPFRHPPLEGLSETVPETAQASLHAATPTSKANVPCYFHFNTYCIKGDHCPFLHDIFPAQKFPKAVPETIVVHHPLENKASTGSDTGPASVEVPVNPPGDTLESTKLEYPKEIIQQPAPGVVLEEPSPSAESSVPDCEEPGIKLPEENSLPPAEYMNGSPQLCSDQGSDEIVKECAEEDEWWESSPGFDVLVDDGEEHLVYEEDAEYLLAQERESEMLQRGLLPYDYEVPPGYDPLAYPDVGYLYEHGGYDGYDGGDNRYTPEYFHGVPEHASERRNLESSPHRRRRSSRRRHEGVEGREVMDLRDQLRKRRRIDDSPRRRHSSRAEDNSPRRRHSSPAEDNSRERPGRHGMGPLLHGRLASKVGNHMHASAQSKTEYALDDIHGKGWSGYPQNPRHARSRLRERESRRRSRKPPLVLSSEILQGSEPRRSESSQMRSAGATFSGPKTLAQIKEEKRRAREGDGNSSGSHLPRNPRRYGSKDFEGPKPLNELLKDKRRSASANGDANGSENEDHQASEDKELQHNGTLEKQSNGYESDYVYEEEEEEEEEEDDDDEDALHEKLIHMFSS